MQTKKLDLTGHTQYFLYSVLFFFSCLKHTETDTLLHVSERGIGSYCLEIVSNNSHKGTKPNPIWNRNVFVQYKVLPLSCILALSYSCFLHSASSKYFSRNYVRKNSLEFVPNIQRTDLKHIKALFFALRRVGGRSPHASFILCIYYSHQHPVKISEHLTPPPASC